MSGRLTAVYHLCGGVPNTDPRSVKRLATEDSLVVGESYISVATPAGYLFSAPTLAPPLIEKLFDVFGVTDVIVSNYRLHCHGNSTNHCKRPQPDTDADKRDTTDDPQ